MDRLLETILEDLDRRREQDRPLGCLPEPVLEALITDALPPSEVEAAQTHLAECLQCLNAYASLRRLLELAAPDIIKRETPAPARARGGRAWRRVLGLLQCVFAQPIPAGWVVGGAVAMLALTWMISIHPRQQETLRFPQGGKIPSDVIGRVVDRSHETSATVAGVVDSIRDATSHGVEAHILTLTDSAGASYVLFAWGPPTVRQGQSIKVRAELVPANEPLASVTYKGIVQKFVRTESP